MEEAQKKLAKELKERERGRLALTQAEAAALAAESAAGEWESKSREWESKYHEQVGQQDGMGAAVKALEEELKKEKSFKKALEEEAEKRKQGEEELLQLVQPLSNTLATP